MMARQGLGLAAISPDGAEIIGPFAERKGITFPLLSDAGSEVISKYGILNTQLAPDHELFGIPHPGTFVLDAEGRVVSRFFEEAYSVRMTGNALAQRISGETSTPDSPGWMEREHLSVRVHVADSVLAPGQAFLVTADIKMKPGVHVYAPGDHSYIVTRIEAGPDSLFAALEPVYPASEDYHFKPLDEHIPVFKGTFRIRQLVRLVANRDVASMAGEPGASLTLDVRFIYQACDDKVCYMPDTISVPVTIGLRPLEK